MLNLLNLYDPGSLALLNLNVWSSLNLKLWSSLNLLNLNLRDSLNRWALLKSPSDFRHDRQGLMGSCSWMTRVISFGDKHENIRTIYPGRQ